MKVVFVFWLKDSFGGAERRLARIYNELCADEQSIKCDIVLRGCGRDTALRLFEKADCDISNINRIIAFKSSILCLLYIFFSRQYRLVHFLGAAGFNVAMQMLCKISGKKSLYTVCSYREAYNIFPHTYMRKMITLLHRVDYVDLLYPSGYSYILQHIKKGKVSVTPGTFTDLSVFNPLEKEHILVYAAARLEDSKNPILFIKGINLCKKALRQEGFKVYLLGKGKYEDYLKQYIEDNNLSDFVEMVGYDKTSKYLPKAGVFCSLQKLENYPSQSLAEAAASGCYLIITDVGDSRRCADEAFASFINDSPEELAEAIKKYIELSDDEKKSVVKNARVFAEENYSIEASKEYFKSLLIDAGRR